MTVGVATGIGYSYTGHNAPFVEGGATSLLPSQGFTLDGGGAGAFGGSATADFLALGAGAFSMGAAANPCQCVGTGAEVRAFAVSQDILTANGGGAGLTGKIAITFDVTGTNQTVVSGTELLDVDSRTVFNVYYGPAALAQPVTTTTPGSVGLLAQKIFRGASVNEPFRVEIPVSFGSDVVVYFQLISVAEGSVVSGTYQAATDFTHTFSIGSVDILDAAGMPVANGSLTAASGAAYPLLPVPEPGTAWMLGITLAGLCTQMRRRGGSA